ncbi:hypothetical protein MO973_25140 [Paenibacillus sp. TRM 82003]|nr:hypothetical protein [Paenibacillus sp. TRM 82003]
MSIFAKNKKVALIVSILCAVALSVWFMDSANGGQQGNSRHYSTKITADRASFGDVKGLVGISDFVVRGHYKDHIQTIRNTNEAGTYYSEGDTYRFVVEEHLQGSAPAEIEVYVPHFSRHTASANGTEFQADVDEPHYAKPDPSKQYILFLKKVPQTDIYSPSSAPFQIEVGADRNVLLKFAKGEISKTAKANNGASMKFIAEPLEVTDRISGKKLDEVLKQIRTEVITKGRG